MLDDDGAWWARREVKPGKQPPANYHPIETDANTGKTVGWEPAGQSSFAKFWREALDLQPDLLAGTYELIGPKVNGNPEGRSVHMLIRHGLTQIPQIFPPAELVQELWRDMG